MSIEFFTLPFEKVLIGIFTSSSIVGIVKTCGTSAPGSASVKDFRSGREAERRGGMHRNGRREGGIRREDVSQSAFPRAVAGCVDPIKNKEANQ